MDRLYNIVKREKGAIDIVVANAGFVEMSDTANVTLAHFDKTFNINARGTFFSVQKALPLYNDNGAIVVVSSAIAVKFAGRIFPCQY
ncbi:SDR family oxidoreductase [Chitinophaga sp. LS1]|uniref:SDR family oxidoreductase n=1 Tax=Chitinophaga sp. LS1 TaxID=3051176 RepID=UPI002AAB3DCD|nr:SDR family oxidoreductase [Chitinophaga sp. LS1]WPV70686.1 SDR family oxidoreductase [Chitinophaga sp. LS1]